MNCCNSYGKCTQGNDCPVRQACELPIEPVKRTGLQRIPGPLLDLLLVIFMVGAIIWLLAYVGPALDEPVSPSLSDAQAQAQRELRRELAAAKMCRETHGESILGYDAGGQEVCIPRGYVKRK